MDTYYPLEVKICSKNGWSTPQEVPGIWGVPYARTGVTIHWWGDGTGADNHDNIVNYFLGQANAGIKSVNYVVSDNKITLMVSPDNVAWCSNSGNPTTISIEHQPTLGDEGYKKSGWLVAELEGRYGRTLDLFPHNHWTTTACPGSIDLGRIRAEADKWKSGAYTPANPNPAPDPTPAPTVVITNSVLPKPVMYRFNKNANLWNYNSATWGGFTAVKSFNQGDLFTVYAVADNHNVNAKYGVTEYSYTKNITNGVNMVDLDLVTEPTQPIPTPPVEQNPTPTPDPGTVVTPEPGATGPTGSVDAPTGPTDAPSGPTGPTTPQPVDTNWKALIAAVIAAIAAVIAAVGAWIK
jgi:hypothetical protein